MSITEVAPVATPDLAVLPGDPEMEMEEPDMAHLVRKDDWPNGYIAGQPIKALCGKTWVPSTNPEGLPVCQVCIDRHTEIQREKMGMGAN